MDNAQRFLSKKSDDVRFDEAGLVELGKYLQKKNYRFTTVTPATHAHNLGRRRIAEDLRDIFGWSLPFERSLLKDYEFQLIESSGVLEPCAEYWRSAVRWSSLDDFLLVHSAYPTVEENAVFFGPDTYRFIRLIKDFLQTGPEVHRAVDIGSGSGVGAMVLASRFPQARVMAVDINPRALRFCAVNARLNSIENIQPVMSDVLTDVEGCFDLIVANPPYMMDPENRRYRQGGGVLGEELSWKIVEAALSHLCIGGTLLLYTGVAIVNGKDLFREKLEDSLQGRACSWHYEEIDPDVFGEELLTTAYSAVERIAVIGLRLTLDGGPGDLPQA